MAWLWLAVNCHLNAKLDQMYEFMLVFVLAVVSEGRESVSWVALSLQGIIEGFDAIFSCHSCHPARQSSFQPHHPLWYLA